MAIQKLTLQDDTRLVYAKDYVLALRYIQTTVNQLVDAVNKLETMAKNTNTVLKSLVEENKTPAENLQDKFAEQREWIGKLCWFWCTNENYADLGILQAITPANTSYKYLKKDSSIWYSNCEPVKPDDDIIYKGE